MLMQTQLSASHGIAPGAAVLRVKHQLQNPSSGWLLVLLLPTGSVQSACRALGAHAGPGKRLESRCVSPFARDVLQILERTIAVEMGNMESIPCPLGGTCSLSSSAPRQRRVQTMLLRQPRCSAA